MNNNVFELRPNIDRESLIDELAFRTGADRPSLTVHLYGIADEEIIQLLRSLVNENPLTETPNHPRPIRLVDDIDMYRVDV